MKNISKEDIMNIWNVSSVSSVESQDTLSKHSTTPLEQKQYIIRCGVYVFVAVIIKDPSQEMDRVWYGGRKKNCVQYSIYWDEEEGKYPHLEGISYNENCTLNSDLNLEKKTGTIRLVKSSIQFIASLYPTIQGVLFKDTSMMKCLGNVRIPLSEFYIAKHGETWYQSKFKAKPFANKEYEKNFHASMAL